MFVTVTVKIIPSPEDNSLLLVDTFRSVRMHFDALREGSAFGPPNKCSVRYLVEGVPEMIHDSENDPQHEDPAPDQVPDVP